MSVDFTDTKKPTLDEEYKDVHPHAYHLQLPDHHKTDGGIPYATIHAHRQARALVRLVNNLELTEEFFVDPRSDGGGREEEGGGESCDDEDVFDDDDAAGPSSLHQFSLHCNRIRTLLSASWFTSSSHNPAITKAELCHMLLKILRLLCATVEIVETDDEPNDMEEEELKDGVSSMAIDGNEAGGGANDRRHRGGRKAILHYDDVGYILNRDGTKQLPDGMQQPAEDAASTLDLLEESLSHPFALPSPARQTLLYVADQLCGEKNELSGVSNLALYDVEGDDGDDGGAKPGEDEPVFRMIVNHHALLRMLLRVAPYLDEHKLDIPPKESEKLKRSELKRTVVLIQECRQFFDQGGQTSFVSDPAAPVDITARELWSTLSSDLCYHTHSNSCYRALIILYLFHPSKCSKQYYSEVLPIWMECWGNIDRNPEWDHLWMELISRARKHISLDDASTLRPKLLKHLLTASGYWLQIPVGGMSSDKSFPRMQAPSKRSIPSRLKLFLGSDGRYEEGMDFVSLLCKLLLYCAAPLANAVDSDMNDNGEEQQLLSEGTAEILRFLNYIQPYYNPSNTGAWTFPLGALLYYLAYELSSRIGAMAGWKVLQRDHPNLALRLLEEEPYLASIDLPPNEVAAFLDVLVPLCQQALYAKNKTVGQTGEMAMVCLAQIDPTRVSPPLIDFSLRALDVSSVNLAHQAPSALSALSRLTQPALRAQPSIIFSRLPDMLRLSLAGIDSNDQEKSLKTLVFYRNLVMWIPVGGTITLPNRKGDLVLSYNGEEGTIQVGKHLMAATSSFVESTEYKAAIAALPENSVLTRIQAVSDDGTADMEEAMLAMADWSLAFLDRIYELLRAAGEQEKLGKGQGGTGMRHTSADVATTRNFSRILKETEIYLFAAMDDETFNAATRSLVTFFQEETLPFAVKDASLLCQAFCSTRFCDENMSCSPGLDALVPVLTENLNHVSSKKAIYRLRCLSGAIRYAGATVLKHREAITSAIELALSKQDDRILFKTGCKLLRHTLASQCEEYPIAQCCHPMRVTKDGELLSPVPGMSAVIGGDKVVWNIPSPEQIDFAVSMLDKFALTRWNKLGGESEGAAGVNLQEWRQTLRVIRYALRGCSGILLDDDPSLILAQEADFAPREYATAKLLSQSSTGTRSIIDGLRKRLCCNVMSMMALVASDTIDESKLSDDENGNKFGSISSDPKICKEIIQLTDLLTSRRGAQFKSSLLIWDGQKDLLTNWCLYVESEYILSKLSRSNRMDRVRETRRYDGEDAGSTISRALVVNRIHITNQTLTASASTQVPRRLRKLQGEDTPEQSFSLGMTLQELLKNFDGSADEANWTSIGCYQALVDGLFSLACHPNINVRGSALQNVEFTLRRFGWLVKNRTARLLAAISLNDDDQKGVHGIPSCAQLALQLNPQGKRTRLAEVAKGVAKISALPKVISKFTWGEHNSFVKAICGTQKLLKLLPPEELPKLVNYINSIFLAYRSKFFAQPRKDDIDQATHEACLTFLLNILQPTEIEGSKEDNGDVSGAMHWRDRLVAAWFILQFVDEQDLLIGNNTVVAQLWSTCFKLIEEEQGQPLQRVALGLLGRLVSLALVDMSQSEHSSGKGQNPPDVSALRSTFSQETFLTAFANALVFDHKVDSSVGGGHSAQWSSGVQEIIKDSTLNVAKRTLFPFSRSGLNSHTFKLNHAQLIEGILLATGHDSAKMASLFLLEQAKVLVASPPSEDQMNQMCSSAEIFSGVARGVLQYSNSEDERNELWKAMLLPFLDFAIVNMPSDFLAAFLDALRYSIYHFPPQYFFPLVEWSVLKVKNSLWQHDASQGNGEGVVESSVVTDRFALQGKWLLVFMAVLKELDCEDDVGAAVLSPFYSGIFFEDNAAYVDKVSTRTEMQLGHSWSHVNKHITPCLLNAISHPYDKCRDHIATCLFQLCYSYRKVAGSLKATGIDNECVFPNPAVDIMNELTTIRDAGKYSFKEKTRALGTCRKFITLCVHWGDLKHEYSEFIIPLLPQAFISLQQIEGEVSPEDRGIESECIKGWRNVISDISSSCVACYTGGSDDLTQVLKILKDMSSHDYWQIRQAAAHFLRCFQGSHKFILTEEDDHVALSISISLLSDDRREVSNAATSTLTGILAVFPQKALEELVDKYIRIASKSIKKKKRKKVQMEVSAEETASIEAKEKARAARQQKSVFFLCAVVMGRPYDVPKYVPRCLAELSKHSFEHRASIGVRDQVKLVCSEFKKTHTDNWESHRKQFTTEQLEALEDVVSTPHYYA